MLLHIFSWFWQWKNFENRLIFDELKAYQKTVPFWGHPVYQICVILLWLIKLLLFQCSPIGELNKSMYQVRNKPASSCYHGHPHNWKPLAKHLISLPPAPLLDYFPLPCKQLLLSYSNWVLWVVIRLCGKIALVVWCLQTGPSYMIFFTDCKCSIEDNTGTPR